ncbi:MAG: dihydrolipoyl dehydrogenase [Acidobacteriota bacterium]
MNKNPNTYDLVVIGSGPGGYVAAVRGAQLGMKTAIVERDKLGGICLNWGCIPTKALLKNAEIYQLFQHSEEWGISHDNLRFDFSKVIDRSRSVADRISKNVGFLMKKNNISTFFGKARLAGKQRVEILDEKGQVKETLSTTRVLVATGARPRTLPGVEFDGQRIIGSTEAMIQKQVPKKMLIIGAGAIGVEFAYFYHAFGTEVTLVEMMPTILPIEDREISNLLLKSFKKRGIQVHTETKVESLGATGGGIEATMVNAKDEKSSLTADIALMAIGVRGNTEDLGLEKVGVKIEKSFIQVDNQFRTSAENVSAIGDVIGPPWLAHVASTEAIVAVEAMAGVKDGRRIDYDKIPGCTYCQPQVASVGLTEEKARDKGYEIKIGRFPFLASGKARATGETEGLVKLIFEAKYGELLGAHILGSEATEMIAELALAKTLEATYEEILNTVHAHPTLSEATMDAAGEAFGLGVNL